MCAAGSNAHYNAEIGLCRRLFVNKSCAVAVKPIVKEKLVNADELHTLRNDARGR